MTGTVLSWTAQDWPGCVNHPQRPADVDDHGVALCLGCLPVRHDLRVLVTGSRTWTDGALIEQALSMLLDDIGPFTLVHGACPRGADALADRWARRYPGRVRVERYPAAWWRYGRSAGPARNAVMVHTGHYALCVAFIRDHSRGATNCARLADEADITTVALAPERR